MKRDPRIRGDLKVLGQFIALYCQCKHCPDHCYYPTYREQIRKVMAFSGRQMVVRGRLDYLDHRLT